VRPAANPGSRPAVFLDRDGTIIEDTGYLRDPNRMRLLPGAAAAIRRLNEGRLPALVVTNQSGIARGLLSEEDYRSTERRLDELLAREGARLEGHYFCPHLPDVDGPCECRKPGTLLYRRAAEQIGLDLSHSWWVGDRMRDLLPALAFGGRGVLVLTGSGESEAAEAHARGFSQAPDLGAAAEIIVGPHPERAPQPRDLLRS
jgi:D-glycero-D-manno-heptose 1,7-bisphosphate phosphatase